MLRINWLNVVIDENGNRVGILICGPMPDDNGSSYYIVQLYTGRKKIDYKDILLQRHKGGPAEHYSGS